MFKKRRALLTLLLAVFIAKASSDSVSLLELMKLRQNVEICRGEVPSSETTKLVLDFFEIALRDILVKDVQEPLDSRAEIFAKEMLSVVSATYDTDPCRIYLFMCKSSGYAVYQAGRSEGGVRRVVTRAPDPTRMDWEGLADSFWDVISMMAG